MCMLVCVCVCVSKCARACCVVYVVLNIVYMSVLAIQEPQSLAWSQFGSVLSLASFSSVLSFA